MPWTAVPAPFTKYTDFVGEIRIAGINDTTMGAAVIEELEGFITKYEKELFKALLSETVYDAFVAAMAGVSTPDTKWTDLRTQLMAYPTAANYIYYKYRKDTVSSYAVTAEVQPVNENSMVVSPAVKMVRAWNEMSDQLHDLTTWLSDREATYQCQANGANFYALMLEYSPINYIGI